MNPVDKIVNIPIIIFASFWTMKYVTPGSDINHKKQVFFFSKQKKKKNHTQVKLIIL